MSGTNTVRVTFDEESMDELWEYNPIPLNEPELIRFFVGMGLLKAKEMAGEDVRGGRREPPVVSGDESAEENENHAQ